MKERRLSDYKVTQVATREFRNRRIAGADFTGQRLEGLRLFDSVFTNCSFDGAVCRDLRMWGTTVRDCTFRRTDLRDSGLGGVLEAKVNNFERVDFSGADLRRTAHGSSVFTECVFDQTNLTKVDFQGSRFTRCRFRGELREVLFYDHGFDLETFEANRMEDVDFSGAQLRWVAFRRLNLDGVVFPSDENHVIIRHYPAFLDYALDHLQGESSLPDRILYAVFTNAKKWLAPGQSIGVINRLDLVEGAGGRDTLVRLDYLLANAASKA